MHEYCIIFQQLEIDFSKGHPILEKKTDDIQLTDGQACSNICFSVFCFWGLVLGAGFSFLLPTAAGADRSGPAVSAASSLGKDPDRWIEMDRAGCDVGKMGHSAFEHILLISSAG